MLTKTIKEWLETLEEPYREQALVNFESYCNDDDQVESVIEALYQAFYWEESPEGHRYWSKLVKTLEKQC